MKCTLTIEMQCTFDLTSDLSRANAPAKLRGNNIRMRAQRASSIAPSQLQRSLGRRRVGLKVAASTAAVRRHRQPLMPLQLDPRPEAGFRSALDPGALCSGTVRLMIQHETGLHCRPTLSTCRFAVFHGVISDEDPKLVRRLTPQLSCERVK